MNLEARIDEIRKRIEAAAVRSGRRAEDVKLVAVTKQVEPEVIVRAARYGLLAFGENYAQELRLKQEIVNNTIYNAGVEWHFIGRLQRNKVKYLVGSVALIHSLDTVSAASEIDRRARAGDGIKMPVLVEVNTGGETKGGVEPETLDDFLSELSGMEGVDVRGLMTMPPYFDDPDSARPYFAKLRDLRDKHSSKYQGLKELSMGMSGDFETAIEEGATIVRIGSAIFGSRA
ncbi:MAG TPA: YggS family pyridoxal phosphate-dependent enzyme [Thermodesulfobacteriota bacterium]|nr:YggS family pyridoxal phosphate-dependent enzyme [Thermodesulfobacteriota bacterium]